MRDAFTSLSKAPNLKILVSATNQIISIPNELTLLDQLNGLVLDKNPTLNIDNLTKLISHLQILKVLLLRKNQLRVLPENLHGLSNLAVLELGNNSFSEVEKTRIKSLLPNTNVVF